MNMKNDYVNSDKFGACEPAMDQLKLQEIPQAMVDLAKSLDYTGELVEKLWYKLAMVLSDNPYDEAGIGKDCQSYDSPLAREIRGRIGDSELINSKLETIIERLKL